MTSDTTKDTKKVDPEDFQVYENTIHPELLGVLTDLHVGVSIVSGNRVQMQGTHYQQKMDIVGAELRGLFTGSESEYAKYMFDIVVEFDCYVERIIHRKSKSFVDCQDILETFIFVRRLDDEKTIDLIHVPRRTEHDKYFGSEYILTDTFRNLTVDKFLREGTRLAECPSVIENEWCVGTHANTLLMSHNEVIEDASLASTSLCDKMLTHAYQTHTMSIGRKEVPLPIYGTYDNPRLHPDINEKVRPDGILFAKRKIDPILAAVEMTNTEMTRPCGHFDRCTFVDPESKVVDIKTYRDMTKQHKPVKGYPVPPAGISAPSANMSTPVKIQESCNAYADGMNAFYMEVLKYYKHKKRVTRGRFRLTPVANQLVKFAIAIFPGEVLSNFPPRRLRFGDELLDDYHVEVTVRYPVPMTISGKATDAMGGKTVLGSTYPPEKMPVDDFGNVVDIIMSDKAMLRRTNFNRPFEIYINAAARDVKNRAIDMFDNGDLDAGWAYMLDFCNTVSPRWAEKLELSHPTDEKREELLNELRTNRLRMHIPSNLRRKLSDIEYDVENKFPPNRSKLTMLNGRGEWVRTEQEFIIGELYILRLDKTGREMSAVSAGKFQHFGTLAKLHSAAKYRRPISESPIKHTAESEGRHQQGYIGGDVCAEGHDRSNNPVVADEVIRAILKARNPTSIRRAVDRNKYPLGNDRVTQTVNHVNACGGVTFTTRFIDEPREDQKL